MKSLQEKKEIDDMDIYELIDFCNGKFRECVKVGLLQENDLKLLELKEKEKSENKGREN